MDTLVTFLISKQQPVRAVLKPDETLDEFVACMKRKFVNLVFTDTKGNTEIGIKIAESSVKAEEIDDSTETIILRGECGLNFEKIKVKVELSLKDFAGFAEITVG
ncbi:MAG: hypothetical protein J6L77_04060 [Coprococcus sp.]|nr:hypothetical protein [Coprococcus sp.]